MGAYTMDSHNTQRFVHNGMVKNEGDKQAYLQKPYSISYRAITPRAEECENLLVPWSLSATHIAFGSIRMEPVFMILGQSAGTAACLAIDKDTSVQKLEYATLRQHLRDNGQVLRPKDQQTKSRRPENFAGIVVDDPQASFTEGWTASQSIGPYLGLGYHHDGNTAKGRRAARFAVNVPEAGRYTVAVSYTTHPNRAAHVPVTIEHAEGETTARVNQQQKPKGAETFVSIGTYRFDRGKTTITISNEGTSGYVAVDAVQLKPRKD
jgi:hypothetical protein